MAERVDRITIRKEVFKKLNSTAEPEPRLDPDNSEDEKKILLDDLGMGPTFRRGMALPYTLISRRYDGAAITQSEAQDLRTVKDSVDLVYKRANA